MENETSYQKQIHDYLEGSLSPEQERQLFDNLSSNTEWRDELAFQMRMQQSAQKDLGSVSIPAKTTAGIFASLGFGVPPQVLAPAPRKRRRVPFVIALQGLFATLGKESVVFGMGVLSVLGVMTYVAIKNFVTTDPPQQQRESSHLSSSVQSIGKPAQSLPIHDKSLSGVNEEGSIHPQTQTNRMNSADQPAKTSQ